MSVGLKILVIRPDRLGDVILSTPVFEAIRSKYPDAHVTAMVQGSIAPLLRGLSTLDDVWIYERQGIRNLTALIQAGKFDVAVTLQSDRRVAFAVWLAGVPRRIGPRSKPHSFLFYNEGIRQHRSRVEMHEADYNLALLERMGIEVQPRRFFPRISLADDVRNEAKAWLRSQGYGTGPLVAIHPGMGGSALNWPQEHYLELIRSLIEKGQQVLVTGGVLEAGLLDRIRGATIGGPRSPGLLMIYGGRESKGLDFLAGLFSFATVVVAPSTGPLHMAGALGCRLVSFYPPIRVQSARRWGPYVQDPSKVEVLVPRAHCDEVFRCRRDLCKSWPCMRSLSVQEAMQAVEKQLDLATEAR